jgi:hypothetical protein
MFWCKLDIRLDCAKQCLGAKWTLGWIALNNVLVQNGHWVGLLQTVFWCKLDIRLHCSKQRFGANRKLRATALNHVLVQTG